MSTDDLTRRAREWAARWPTTNTSALVSELADEVDQLRESALDSRLNIEGLEVELHEAKTERDRWKERWQATVADADAARAALERVRALHVSRPYDYAHDFVTFGQTEFPDKCTGCREDYPCETARALEGEPS